MAGGLMGGLANAGAALYGAAWEARRDAYARGWLRPRRVATRVVSIGNLTLGGTGKTTLTLYLARLALRAGFHCAVVCRDYRADSTGMSDEAHLYEEELADGEQGLVYVGRRKSECAAAAAAAGVGLILVDDGFSTWSLERDLNIVLLDARDLWGGEALVPAGRLREPRRALQRADVVVVSRLGPGEDPEPLLSEVRGYAPAARLAAGRHAVRGVAPLRPWDELPATRRVRIVTGTGNPGAVATSAREAGLEVVALAAYPDHHWFSGREVRHELAHARREDAVVLLTAKDAVRWGQPPNAEPAVVLRVGWEWVTGGEGVDARVLGEVG